MARPKKYASAAEKQAAYRERYAVVSVRMLPKTVETLDKIAEETDSNRNEVINSVLMFGLLNRNWLTLGLFGKSLPRANPIDPNFPE
jgi:hypothetical protein